MNISDTSEFIHSIDDIEKTSFLTEESEFIPKSNTICFKSNFVIISITFTNIKVSILWGRKDNAILKTSFPCLSSIYEYALRENSSKSITVLCEISNKFSFPINNPIVDIANIILLDSIGVIFSVNRNIFWISSLKFIMVSLLIIGYL